MKRILLIVAYDGTEYCGWQIQPNGVTIEAVLNRELTRLLGEEIKVIGASRTDAGVHAMGNVCVFDTDTRIPPEKISYALNQSLPEDIVVQQSKEVAADFHPRKCESRKTYEYRILNRAMRDPNCRRNTYFYHWELDTDAMQEAASYLVGEHDFQSFCSPATEAETTVRTIYALTVEKEGDLITIRITGNGFLYNMVRIIAGTLLEVGNGKRKPEEIAEILEKKDRSATGPTAPACGLTLMEIAFVN
ncbi:MAG: tRNA pseudouridine(38-40) synthase TruA [Lachnospiraceae bacterium]|nr:tRNA pseudouridine(38-40) synthase TruA [Lachnospiraceae bacterium]